MIAYEILTGKSAFSEPIEKVTNSYRPAFPDFVSEKMQKLLSRCWSWIPSERPRFKELFDELSSDFSYFEEAIDKEEIQRYLDHLLIKQESDSHEAEFDELKVKITELDSNKPKQLKIIPFLEELSMKGNSIATYLAGLLYENDEVQHESKKRTRGI